MSLGTGSPLVNEKEVGVFLAKGCKVPPNSVMRVGAQLSESMAGEYIVKAIEPTEHKQSPLTLNPLNTNNHLLH